LRYPSRSLLIGRLLFSFSHSLFVCWTSRFSFMGKERESFVAASENG
jgi:hypothetical protein